jgi:predicted acyl esterase
MASQDSIKIDFNVPIKMRDGAILYAEITRPDRDGKVGMYGESFLGHTQWLAAITQPPHLKAIVPKICSIHRGASFLKGWDS